MTIQKIEELTVCPVCNKTFTITADTCCLISGDYTCSWKCFLDEVKRRDERKKSKCK